MSEIKGEQTPKEFIEKWCSNVLIDADQVSEEIWQISAEARALRTALEIAGFKDPEQN